MSISDLKEENAMLRKRSMLHTAFFLIGFSIIFIAIGFGTSFVGTFFVDYQNLLYDSGPIKYRAHVVSFGITYDF